MFTQEEEEELHYLIHDKGHILKHGQRSAALDKALEILSMDCTGLWRGLYREEVDQVRDVLVLDHYKSFSESRQFAEQFGETGYLLHVVSARGFCLHSWGSKQLEKLRVESPEQFDSCDGEFMIDSYKEELEWILAPGTELKVVEIRKEGELTVIVAHA